MYHIHIRCAEEKDATVIMFPVPEDGHVTMDDLRSAFSNLSSLRYTDNGDDQQHHILCRNGIFVTPEGGWKRNGRIFLAVTQQSGSSATRFGLFESYRNQLATRQRSANLPSRRKTNTQRSSESSTTMMTVGHGQFRVGRFTKITSSNLSGCGGIVVVGPFEKAGNTAEEIKDKAFLKFQQQNSSFRRKYKHSKQFVLLYPDGSPVAKLPDASEEFSIAGYRNFVDPMKRFDRLRLYICETTNVHENQPIELWTSSSSDDDLPTLRTATSLSSFGTSTRASSVTDTSLITDASNDDTLPLCVEVTFNTGDGTFKEKFPNNSKVLALLEYAAERMGTLGSLLEIKVDTSGLKLDADDRLMNISTNSVLYVSVTETVNSKEEEVGSFPIRSDFTFDDDKYADLLSSKTLSAMTEVSEPIAIMKKYQEIFLRGRSLDVIDEHTALDGDTSPIFVSRANIFEDTMSETRFIENIRLPLDVSFLGESAVDVGGPRKEFLSLILKEIKETLLEESDGKIILKGNDEAIARHKYYFAGLLIGLSAIEGGPFAPYLDSVLSNSSGEMKKQLENGLRRTGILQLITKKSTIKYLFRPQTSTMNVTKLLSLFSVAFSIEGSNRRQQEETTYSHFVRYVREVYAGRRGNVNLNKILQFTTGCESEPVLGFSLKPTVEFADTQLPTANTCINRLVLPLGCPNYDLMDLAFCNEFFGFE